MDDSLTRAPGRRPILRRAGRLAASSGAIGLLAIALMLWSRSDGGRADATAPEAPRGSLVPASAGGARERVGEEDAFALLAVPEPARPQTREEKRFARIDRNDDGFVSQAEFLAARRRNFDKLDINGDGVLAFEEYAAEGIRRFAEVDRNGDRRLDPAEFALTARPPKTATAARPAGSAGGADCVCS